MSRLAVVLDDCFKAHETGRGHPERAQRIDAVRLGLEASGVLPDAQRIAPVPIELSLLAELHDADYIERARRACESGAPYLDSPDSTICRQSFEVALLAAGSVVAAARHIAAGDVRRAFCAVRPPGHHAERAESMGFCLFNNIALAAHWLTRHGGFERVLILDWDVHHGNGTQHLFEYDPRVMFISLHGHPNTLYPGTGFEYEVGRGAGAYFTLNLPFEPGAGDEAYRRAFETKVIPTAEEFDPQMVLISCGFDAHSQDPLGTISLSDDAYDMMLTALLEVAERHASGRVLSVLEGGYNLGVLERCSARHAARLGSI